VAAVAGDGQVALEWGADSEPDLAGYRVYRRNPDGSWPVSPTAETTASSFVDSGLENGVEQVYRVTAFDRAGNESAVSAEVSATPTVPEEPAAPSAPTASPAAAAAP
jgi:fibronectin type 3 domain-containing protein